MPNLRSLKPYLLSTAFEMGTGVVVVPVCGPSIANSSGQSASPGGPAACGNSGASTFLPRGATITTSRMKPMSMIHNAFPLTHFGSGLGAAGEGGSCGADSAAPVCVVGGGG